MLSGYNEAMVNNNERSEKIASLQTALESPTITIAQLEVLRTELGDEEDLVQIVDGAIRSFDSEQRDMLYSTFIASLAAEQDSIEMQNSVIRLKQNLSPEDAS
jgi:hypothetical protein